MDPHESRSVGACIVDIRRDREGINLQKDIHDGLHAPDGSPKSLPTLLLYDEAGLKLFEDITYLDDYYLTGTEIQLLQDHADSIARHLTPGAVLLELGSGNLRKIDILLKAIDRAGKAITYYALDVSRSELERTLSAIPAGTYQHVECSGLLGTYDDGLEWLRSPAMQGQTKYVLSIGSSIGNFSRLDAGEFLRGFADALQPNDGVIIALDACEDPARVYRAYNDSQGVTHRFTLNGLSHANRLLKEETFAPHDWQAVGQYDESARRHEAFVSPTREVTVAGSVVKSGERIRIEQSHKYNARDRALLWSNAGLQARQEWASTRGDYFIHFLQKSHAMDPLQYASSPVPSWQDFTQLWKIWDSVTRQMIPEQELESKPIKLRNACIFYLGHIPTFFDIKLSTVCDGGLTEPQYFSKIFERGIDPDVDDPALCHDHSEIPESWPPLHEILSHQERVRNRVRQLYETGKDGDARVARALWLGYEHECMHLETLLYMLVQSDKTLPPPLSTKPDFTCSEQRDIPNEWITVPESDVVLGTDDPETPAGPPRFFGWDIEKPSRQVHVPSFQSKARPLSNGDYAAYLHKTGSASIPVSWLEHKNPDGHTASTTNGSENTIGSASPPTEINDTASLEAFLHGKAVRTVYGPVPLAKVLSWPVSASYDELDRCAQWMGGRIPTWEETQSIYNFVEASNSRAMNAHQVPGRKIPAVNGHLVNDGVEESPPHKGALKSAADANASSGTHSCDPRDSFIDLKGMNVGFQHWHPVPVTQNGNRLSGQGDMGGLWEWTSTPLAKHEGWEAMPLYPAFSADFFDGKHNVVLGGSWATMPRIAGRKSFVNWYQRNYPYVWAGARLVRDI